MSSQATLWREMWGRNWPGSFPNADEMKRFFPDRWVRFHALPEGKRYPDREDEYQTILGRHHTLLGELSAHNTELLVVTAVYDSRVRTRRSGHVVHAVPKASHWWSFETKDSEPDWPMWCSIFVSKMPTSPEALDPLLRLVIDDIEHGVILTPANFTWIYHPYDGGADVLLPTSDARDELRTRHKEWLSNLPSGL